MSSRWIVSTVIAGALLSGCGGSGVEIGDVFVVDQSFIGGETIKAYKDAFNDEDKTIEIDGYTVYSLEEGQEVEVVGISKDDDMVRIEITEGYDEGTRWWTHEKVLTRDGNEIITD